MNANLPAKSMVSTLVPAANNLGVLIKIRGRKADDLKKRQIRRKVYKYHYRHRQTGAWRIQATSMCHSLWEFRGIEKI